MRPCFSKGSGRRRPFAYRPGKTILHRTPALIKLVCMILISVTACVSVYGKAAGLAASIFLVIVFSIAARIQPWEPLRGSKPLIAISLCVLIMKTIDPGSPGLTTPEIIFFNRHIPGLHIPALSPAGFPDGVITVLRIFTPFAAASLFFTVTSMRELRLSIAALEKKATGIFSKKTAGAFFSLGISLMMGFIPRFFDLWENANLACEARSCKRGLRRMIKLIPPVVVRMMEAAADTATAVEARGWYALWGVY